MRNWYRTIVPALGVACLAMLLAGCNSGGTGSGNTGGKLCIGTDFPTSGTDASEGQPAENGVRLAVMQNQNLGNGYTLEVRSFNDVSPQTGIHDGPTGAQNVQQMVGLKCLVAMVGPFNSGVAGAEMPIAANAELPMISPSNTNVGLTLRQYATENGFNFDSLHPPGKPENYFRISGNDVVQGTVDADLTITAKPDGLGAKNVYVLDDTEPYGKGLANYFIKELTAKGGAIIGHDEISSMTSPAQLPTLAAKIVGTHPDAVFFGGVTSNDGGLMRAQLVQAGYTGPYVGGDGIAEDPAFLTQAGAAAEGTYGSVAAPDLSTFTTGKAKQFVDDYQAAFNSAPGPYSANSYDAAIIEIQAIKSLISAGKTVTRAALVDLIHQTQYDGVTGHISFDANGDNSGTKVFSIYGVQGGKWVFFKQENV